MIGIIYRKSDNKITHIVEDVVSYNNTDLTGTNSIVKGIDLTQASFCIVASTICKVGDTLGTFTDVRVQIPDPDTELNAAIINSTTLDELKKALTGTNGRLAKVVGRMK